MAAAHEGRTFALVLRLPCDIALGGRGDDRMGVCGGLVPTLSPIPYFP